MTVCIGKCLIMSTALSVLAVAKYGVKGLPKKCSCEDGQYCADGVCKTCPNGQFQTEPIHSFTSCIPWSTKPPLSHYVIAKEGTSKSDRVWKCKDGFKEKQFTTYGYQCVAEVTTEQMRNSTTTLPSTSFPSSFYALTSVSESKFNVNTGVIAGISVCLIVLALVTGLILAEVYRRKKFCFKKCKKQNAVIYKINGNEHILAPIDNNVISDPASESLIPNEAQMYNFFHRLVKEIGFDKTVQLLLMLPDDSGDFNLDNVIQKESKKTYNSDVYLAKCLLIWNGNREKIDRQIFEDTLVSIGRPGVLQDLLLGESKFRMIFSDVEIKNNSAAANIKTINVGNGKKLNKTDRFRFFYYLCSSLGGSDIIKFLHLLPSNKFDAHEFFQIRKTMGYGVQNAFAASLEEWWLTNYIIVSFDCIVPILKELERNDILQDDKFQKCLQKLLPAEVSRGDNGHLN